MEVTFVKGMKSGRDRDRVYLTAEGSALRVAVHPVHDIPHLVVESFFGIEDGLWGELTGGAHASSNRAATARDPERQKEGRIVSGAASRVSTEEWLSEGHTLAKTVTNAVHNRWGDGPDTPQGVRSRLAHDPNASVHSLMLSVDDETIAAAIDRVRDLEERWTATPPGGKLRLSWPLDRSAPVAH